MSQLTRPSATEEPLPWRIIGLFVALVLVIPLIAGSFVLVQTRLIETNQTRNLQSIVNLKAEQIQNWLGERQGDCEMLQAAKGLPVTIDQIIRTRDKVASSDLLERFKNIRMAYGFSSVFLLDAQGQLLLRSGENTDMPEVANTLVQQAIVSRRVQRSELYLDDEQNVQMDWAVPVNQVASGSVAAVIVLRIDPHQFLYPLLTTWPTVSDSAETLLVRQDGDNVLYLNELRRGRDTALKLKLPLNTPDLPPARAIQSRQPGIMQGRDYKGIEVLTAYRPIIGTNWFIVARIDRAEVLEPMWQTFHWISGLSVFAALCILLALWKLLAQQRRLMAYGLAEEQAKANQMLTNFYRIPFVGIGIVSPQTQQWLQVNDHLCKILGYSQQELLNLTWDSTLHTEDTLVEKSGFANLLNGGSQSYSADTRFIHKDGHVIFTSLDAKAVNLPDGKLDHVIVMIDDISERVQANHKIKRINQIYAALSQSNEAIIRCQNAEELFQDVCKVVVNVGGMTLAWIGIVDTRSQKVRVAGAYGTGLHYLEKIQISVNPDNPHGQGPTGTAIRESKPYWCSDNRQDPKLLPWLERQISFGFRASASIPICSLGQTIGALTFYTDQVFPFDVEERGLLIEMAMDIGLALDSLNAKNLLLEKEQQLRALGDNLPHGYVYQFGLTADDQPYFRYISAGVERLHGVTVSQAMADPQLVLRRISASSQATFHENLAKSAQQLSIFSETLQLTTSTGEPQWLRIESRPRKLKDGSVLWDGVALDITSHYQAMQRIEESEERFRKLFEDSSQPLLLLENNRFIAANRAASNLLRWDAPTALIGKSPAEISPEYQADGQLSSHKSDDNITSALEKGRHRLEWELVKKDGEHVFVDAIVTLINFGERSVLHVELNDITEQKQAAAELEAYHRHLEQLVEERTHGLAAASERIRLSEERYAYAISASQDGVWDWSVENNISYCSPSYFRMLGYEPDELSSDMQDHFIDLLHPDDKQRVVSALKTLLETQSNYELEFKMRAKNGDYKWILSRGKVVARNDEGRPVRVVGTHTDLTERKQMEIDLRKANHEQQAIFDAASFGIALIKDRIILRCNQRLAAMFGYESGELVGQSTRIWYEDDSAYELSGMQIYHDVAEGKLHRRELALMRKDGTRFWARITGKALYPNTPDGGIVGCYEDITLEREVTETLKQAKNMAEATAQLKSNFLANMSHEIRTPMNAVLGFCYLLEQRPLDDESLELVRKVHNAGHSLLGVINDILDFSKIEAGRLDIDREPFRLTEMLEDLAALMSVSASKKRLELVITPPENVEGLIGDRQRIQQVLVNLLGNAIKFTEQGEVELRIQVIRQNDSSVELDFKVKDSGIGISKEKQNDIFAAFTQADSSINRRYGGTGLGLAISRQLIELMGGRLAVSSEPGVGTEFSFALTLPVYKAAPVKADYLAHLDVLIADDSATAREALLYTAQNLGWKAETVDSGESALMQVLARWESRCPYDVLLLDWQMPGQDGLKTAQAIQEACLCKFDSRDHAPVVIMVTAYEREILMADPGLAWVDTVLSKPVTGSSLYNAIAGILKQRHPLSPDRQIIARPVQSKQISGLRILVVDDSDFNLELARMLLESSGATVFESRDGQQALDWLAAHPTAVDLILMDVQMPIMDGYSSTKQIRQDSRWQKLPIVALSAGVLKDEQSLALAAGMDDFVAKPLDVEQLIATIQRLTGYRPESGNIMAGAVVNTDTEKAITDVTGNAAELPGLDFKKGIEQWADAAVYQIYLNKFVESYQTCGQTFLQMMVKPDAVAAQTLAHKLKGIAGNLALPMVAEHAQNLETAFKKGCADHTAIQALQGAVDQACQAIRLCSSPDKQAGTATASRPVAEMPESIQFLLEQLLSALNADNPDNAEPYVHKLQHRLPDDVLATLQKQLSLFDFRGAEATTLAELNNLKSSDRQGDAK